MTVPCQAQPSAPAPGSRTLAPAKQSPGPALGNEGTTSVTSSSVVPLADDETRTRRDHADPSATSNPASPRTPRLPAMRRSGQQCPVGRRPAVTSPRWRRRPVSSGEPQSRERRRTLCFGTPAGALAAARPAAASAAVTQVFDETVDAAALDDLRYSRRRASPAGATLSLVVRSRSQLAVRAHFRFDRIANKEAARTPCAMVSAQSSHVEGWAGPLARAARNSRCG
jgi:hypothetical protein